MRKSTNILPLLLAAFGTWCAPFIATGWAQEISEHEKVIEKSMFRGAIKVLCVDYNDPERPNYSVYRIEESPELDKKLESLAHWMIPKIKKTQTEESFLENFRRKNLPLYRDRLTILKNEFYDECPDIVDLLGVKLSERWLPIMRTDLESEYEHRYVSQESSPWEKFEISQRAFYASLFGLGYGAEWLAARKLPHPGSPLFGIGGTVLGITLFDYLMWLQEQTDPFPFPLKILGPGLSGPSYPMLQRLTENTPFLLQAGSADFARRLTQTLLMRYGATKLTKVVLSRVVSWIGWFLIFFDREIEQAVESGYASINHKTRLSEAQKELAKRAALFEDTVHSTQQDSNPFSVETLLHPRAVYLIHAADQYHKLLREPIDDHIATFSFQMFERTVYAYRKLMHDEWILCGANEAEYPDVSSTLMRLLTESEEDIPPYFLSYGDWIKRDVNEVFEGPDHHWVRNGNAAVQGNRIRWSDATNPDRILKELDIRNADTKRKLALEILSRWNKDEYYSLPTTEVELNALHKEFQEDDRPDTKEMHVSQKVTSSSYKPVHCDLPFSERENRYLRAYLQVMKRNWSRMIEDEGITQFETIFIPRHRLYLQQRILHNENYTPRFLQQIKRSSTDQDRTDRFAQGQHSHYVTEFILQERTYWLSILADLPPETPNEPPSREELRKIVAERILELGQRLFGLQDELEKWFQGWEPIWKRMDSPSDESAIIDQMMQSETK